MQSHRHRTAIVCVAFTAICAAIAGCGSSPGPEEAVRLWVRDAQAAVESKDRGTLIDMIADSYADARGNDKSDIERMLRVWFLQSSNIVLVSKIDEITVMGGSAARVLLTAGMAGTNEGLLGLSADALRFELQLETVGEDWMLIGARWADIGADLR